MANLNDVLIKLKNSVDNQIEYYVNGKKLSRKFNEVYHDVITIGRFLEQNGVGKGDYVGILGKNCIEWILIDLACLIKGVITIPFDVNKIYDTTELVQEFELKILFTNLPEYQDVGDTVLPFERMMREAFSSEQQKTTHSDVLDYSEEEIFTVVSTSGTVAKSKYIQIKKMSFDNLVTATQQLFNFKPNDRFLVFLPLSIYLERCYIYSAILLDFSVILTPMEYVFHSIQHDKPSVIIGIPYFFETIQTKFTERIYSRFFYKLVYKGYLLLKDMGLGFLFGSKFAPFIKTWGGNIRYLLTGSAPIRKETLLFYQAMGIAIYEGYGMNEIGGMVALNSPGNVKLGSVGKPFPGKLVFTDSLGQIIVKSDYNANTSYFRSTKEENERTYLPDGQVATGDIGYVDNEGFIYINGRSKDVIVSSTGKKIHPTHIEEKIINTGLFVNCLVYGDNKPFLVLLVVPKNNSVSYQQIKDELGKVNSSLPLDERIMGFHVESEKFTIENQLLTTSLKPNRTKILEKFSDQLNQLYN